MLCSLPLRGAFRGNIRIVYLTFIKPGRWCTQQFSPSTPVELLLLTPLLITLSPLYQRPDHIHNTSHLLQQSDCFSSYLTSSPGRIYPKPLDAALSLCLPHSLSTNTANTSPCAPLLPLSLSQWGVGQACVDSSVATVSLMIQTQCCANMRVSTHTKGAHTSPGSQPISGLLCNNRTLKTFFSSAHSWVGTLSILDAHTFIVQYTGLSRTVWFRT